MASDKVLNLINTKKSLNLTYNDYIMLMLEKNGLKLDQEDGFSLILKEKHINQLERSNVALTPIHVKACNGVQG